MIFLTGMPGSGKTYWGRLVAKEYDLPWIDLDELFEESKQCTIGSFFAEHGEETFRKTESSLLQEVVSSHPKNTIVSCGGGIVLKEESRNLMKQHGCTVYLQTELSQLAQRLEGNKTRPLLAEDTDLLMSLIDLYSKRKAMYEQADFTLPTAQLTVEDFRPIITRCTEQH